MSQNVLLDTNILIPAIEDNNSDEAIVLKTLLQNPEVSIFITPLIRFEVLRGIPWKNEIEYNKFVAVLDKLPNLDIDNNIATVASNLFRFERHKRSSESQESKKIDKHNFDLMHFATAKVHDLDPISNDKDIQQWDKLYSEIQ